MTGIHMYMYVPVYMYIKFFRIMIVHLAIVYQNCSNK